jgi:hypothetical protein
MNRVREAVLTIQRRLAASKAMHDGAASEWRWVANAIDAALSACDETCKWSPDEYGSMMPDCGKEDGLRVIEDLFIESDSNDETYHDPKYCPFCGRPTQIEGAKP